MFATAAPAGPMTLRDTLEVRKETVGGHFVSMLESVDKMDSGLTEAARHLDDRDQWMREWNELINIGNPRSKDESGQEQYDVSIFGPKLKTKRLEVESHATEVTKLLLCKDSDYVDAMMTVDRDNFLADPFECATRDCTIVRQICGFLYTNMRDLFISMPIEEAMIKIHTYKEHIRCVRSLLHMARVLEDDATELHKRLASADVLKEKYEATVFTLRRQLQDMHAAMNTVGRGSDGTFAPQEVTPVGRESSSSSNYTDGTSANKAENKYIVCVQIEGLGKLRNRFRVVMDRAVAIARKTLCSLGHAYEVQRTNYVKSDIRDEDSDEKENPTSFLFLAEEGFNALAFAIETHIQLSECLDWPQALLDMNRFGSELWRGLRVRVGIHHGQPAMMDLPEPSVVPHFEGIAVEKCMRVAALGGAGDVVCSQTAWQLFSNEVKEARVPPSKRFQNLRAMLTEPLNCTRKRGFKKGEVCTKVWPQVFAARQSQPMEAEFPLISFYRLEAGATEEEESDEPTVEELMAVKDTEITMLQQELDFLRLEVIKRDTDLEEQKNTLIFTISKLHEQSRVKHFLNHSIMSSLEEQLMELHEIIARVPESMHHGMTSSSISLSSPTAATTSETGTVEDTDQRRRRMYIEWAKELEAVESMANTPKHEPLRGKDDSHSAAGESIGNSRRNSETDLFRIPRHKNQKLWRELTQMVKGATKNLVQPKRGVTRTTSSGSINPNLAKLHSVSRVYSTLMRRYVSDGDVDDQDNQSISEEQFISLFIQKLQPDASSASAREAMALLTAAAIENDEVEASCAADDARLIRSVGGHLCKVFNSVRAAKKKVAMTEKLLHDARQQLQEADAANEMSSVKGVKKKRAAGTTAAPAQESKNLPGSMLGAPGQQRQSKSPAVSSLRPPPERSPAPTVLAPLTGPRVSSSRRSSNTDAAAAAAAAAKAAGGSRGSDIRATFGDRSVALERENARLAEQLEALRRQLKTEVAAGTPSSDAATTGSTRRGSVGPGSAHLGKRPSIAGVKALPATVASGGVGGGKSSKGGGVPRSHRSSAAPSEVSSEVDDKEDVATKSGATFGSSFEIAEAGVERRHIGVQVGTNRGAASAAGKLPRAGDQVATQDGGCSAEMRPADDARGQKFELAPEWLASGGAAFAGITTGSQSARSQRTTTPRKSGPIPGDEEGDAGGGGGGGGDSLASTIVPTRTDDDDGDDNGDHGSQSGVAAAHAWRGGADGQSAGAGVVTSHVAEIHDVPGGGSTSPVVLHLRSGASQNQNRSESPRLGERVPVMAPKSPLPQKEDLPVTAVEEFTLEQRHRELKEKWAREKAEREQQRTAKRRATVSPARAVIGMDFDDRAGPERPLTSEHEEASSRPASPKLHTEWAPKVTLAPLRTRPTETGGVELVEARSGSPVRGLLTNGGAGGCDLVVTSGNMSREAARAMQHRQQEERDLYDRRQAELQQQLAQLRQLQQQSKQFVRPSSRSGGTFSSDVVPSTLVVGSIAGPAPRGASRQQGGGGRTAGQSGAGGGDGSESSPLPQSQIGYAAVHNNAGLGPLSAVPLRRKLAPPATPSGDVSSIVKQYAGKRR